MATMSLEARVAALEAEMARIKEQLGSQTGQPTWRIIVGGFANDPWYEEAMKYGRQYRESLRLGKRKKRKEDHGSS
jgi:hypothetical protein